MVTMGMPGVTNTSQRRGAAGVGFIWMFPVFAALASIGGIEDHCSC